MENSNQVRDLRVLNEGLENYFRNTVIPQMFIDANLILMKFTPPAMRQFQLTPADIGKHISELKIQIRFPTIIENIQEVIEKKMDLEKDLQTTDLKWYQMNILPYTTGESNLTNGVIVTFVDITFRIEMLNEYEKLNLNYETVLFALSHDLKGPVTNIKSLLGLMRDVEKNDEDEVEILIDSMDISVEKLLKCIGDLTETVEEKNRFADVSERVNIQNILEDVRIGLGNRFFISKAKIHTDFQVTELQFPRKNIRSILYNLLSNALKFSVPGGLPEIWIKTEIQGEYIILSVCDNGVGIEKNKQEMIFFPRIRLDKEIEGTGIGLYIVKRMVEDMGGKVEVESAPGEGADFRIYFKKLPK